MTLVRNDRLPHTQAYTISSQTPKPTCPLRISVMQRLADWSIVPLVRFDSQLSCVRDCYSVVVDSLISNCFNQKEHRPDAGLSEHLLRSRLEISCFIQSMLCLPSTTLIKPGNLYLYFKLYPSTLFTPSNLFPSNPNRFHVLHYPAPPCLYTPNIHSLLHPTRHTRPHTSTTFTTFSYPNLISHAQFVQSIPFDPIAFVISGGL